MLKASYFQDKAKNIYNQLSNLALANPGELEIPALKLSETPLRYYFYTTNRDKYVQILSSQNEKLSVLPPLHPIIQNFSLPNTQFIAKYVLFIHLYK